MSATELSTGHDADVVPGSKNVRGQGAIEPSTNPFNTAVDASHFIGVSAARSQGGMISKEDKNLKAETSVSTIHPPITRVNTYACFLRWARTARPLRTATRGQTRREKSHPMSCRTTSHSDSCSLRSSIVACKLAQHRAALPVETARQTARSCGRSPTGGECPRNPT